MTLVPACLPGAFPCPQPPRLWVAMGRASSAVVCSVRSMQEAQPGAA